MLYCSNGLGIGRTRIREGEIKMNMKFEFEDMARDELIILVKEIKIVCEANIKRESSILSNPSIEFILKMIRKEK